MIKMAIQEFLTLDPAKASSFFRPIVLTLQDGYSETLSPVEARLQRYVFMLGDVLQQRVVFDKTMLVRTYYHNGNLSSNSITITLSSILRYVIMNVKDTSVVEDVTDNAYRYIFSVVNDIYDNIVYTHLGSALSLDIIDLVEVQNNPALETEMQSVKDYLTIEAINKAYDTLDSLLETEYPNNRLAFMYRGDNIKKGQAKQLLGPRGFVTEIDSSIFRYPIAYSFTQGLQDMYAMAIESRSAAKALEQSTRAIQNSEFFARELQLVSMSVRKIIYTDCGSTDTVQWFVKPPEYMAGKETYAGDLKNLIGKTYLDETDGVFKVLNGSEKHLFGKHIQLRAVSKCKLKNPHHVCVACMGEIGYNIPRHANVGMFSATNISSKASQMILSTKHFLGSASSSKIILDEQSRRLFTIKNNGFVLRKDIVKKKGGKILLIVSQEEAYGLMELNKIKNIAEVDASRVTKIEHITIEVHDPDGSIETHTTTVRNLNRYGVFTTWFLSFIMKKPLAMDTYGNFVIDITSYASARPMIILPEVEFSFQAFAAEIKRLTLSRDVKANGTTDETIESLMSKLFSLVNSKMNVNLSFIEIVAYALSARDILNDDYRLARGVDNAYVAGIVNIIDKRSLGASMGYSKLVKKLYHTDGFTMKSATEHPMDVFLAPNEVIKRY